MTKADQDFDVWIEKNPEFYRAFVDLAFQAKDAGRRRVGSKFLCEMIRWTMPVSTSGSAFKVPNVMTPRLARKAMADYPALQGLFVTARLRS